MNRLLAPSLLLSSAALLAQGPGTNLGPVITTTTDFGVFAELGGTLDFDAVAASTAVGMGFEVDALVGCLPCPGDVARAGTHLGRELRGAGVTINERGLVRNADPNQGAAVGTSADAPATTTPVQGAHTVSVNYPNFAMGTDVIVSIRWGGDATAGASCTSAVDVDGDGIADFTGVADGTQVTALFQVTAGATGVTLGLTTDGSAALAADGEESYRGALMVTAFPGTLPTSCTFTTFGPSCGADLAGNVGTNFELSLDVTAAPVGALGMVVLGPQLTTPLPLPFGTCTLLVDAIHHTRWFLVDANGEASVLIPTPRMPLTISLQAVLLEFAPQHQFVLSSSNGLELVCQ